MQRVWYKAFNFYLIFRMFREKTLEILLITYFKNKIFGFFSTSNHAIRFDAIIFINDRAFIESACISKQFTN